MNTDLAQTLEAGLEHHRAGRLREADASYRAVLQENPRQPDALYLLGVLALQTGNAQPALRLFREALAVRPGDPEVLNMCGEAQQELGDFAAAIASYREALEGNPEHAGAWNNLGNACRSAGRHDEAIDAYRRALAVKPDLPMAHNNLGVVLRDTGRIEEALRQFERAIALVPDYAEAYTNLGNVLERLGRIGDAVARHEKAVALRPDYVQARCNLANALRLAGRREEAIRQYKQAIAQRPSLALAHCGLGIVYDEAGQPAQAIERYERALELQPDFPEALNNLGNALDEMGRHEEAERSYRRATELRPDFAEAWRNLTRIAPGRVDPVALEQLLASGGLGPATETQCRFALGNVYQAAGDYGKAFEHFAAGNRLKRESFRYDAAQVRRDVDRLMRVFDGEYFEAAGSPGGDSGKAVFVLGMPRSGTTLVEQILASHPEVHGAGELDTLRQFESLLAGRRGQGASYPECMIDCPLALREEFAGRYLAELERLGGTARRVTDKTPSNFLRIGLLKSLLPQARIIHVRRDPRDTCVSNYTHYFAAGNEFSFDLRELGDYYRQYERLMTHWSGLFPDDILELRYEELLSDQEAVSRRMIGFLGLEWSDACLAFHRYERPVHTFSSRQVRQPIYRSAVGRWKHYEPWLGPLFEALAGDSA